MWFVFKSVVRESFCKNGFLHKTFSFWYPPEYCYFDNPLSVKMFFRNHNLTAWYLKNFYYLETKFLWPRWVNINAVHLWTFHGISCRKNGFNEPRIRCHTSKNIEYEKLLIDPLGPTIDFVILYHNESHFFHGFGLVAHNQMDSKAIGLIISTIMSTWTNITD